MQSTENKLSIKLTDRRTFSHPEPRHTQMFQKHTSRVQRPTSKSFKKDNSIGKMLTIKHVTSKKLLHLLFAKRPPVIQKKTDKFIIKLSLDTNRKLTEQETKMPPKCAKVLNLTCGKADLK